MPLQKGERGMPQPHANLLGFGDGVAVLLPRHADARSGQTGTVKRVKLVNGDLLATVEFADGQRADYYEADLKRL